MHRRDQPAREAGLSEQPDHAHRVNYWGVHEDGDHFGRMMKLPKIVVVRDKCADGGIIACAVVDVDALLDAPTISRHLAPDVTETHHIGPTAHRGFDVAIAKLPLASWYPVAVCQGPLVNRDDVLIPTTPQPRVRAVQARAAKGPRLMAAGLVQRQGRRPLVQKAGGAEHVEIRGVHPWRHERLPERPLQVLHVLGGSSDGLEQFDIEVPVLHRLGNLAFQKHA
mmetsp:Transcript_18976/g.56713  ORF Transcript_18976/g.56713 Transcript_18976/m.56713 type:complete len:224 (-) Transcript_18976:901-1572(-)